MVFVLFMKMLEGEKKKVFNRLFFVEEWWESCFSWDSSTHTSSCEIREVISQKILQLIELYKDWFPLARL